MKELLAIEPWGVWLYRVVHADTGRINYLFEFADVCAPVNHEVQYETVDEALGDIVNYILNPDNVYSMDEQPENIQKAYELAGTPLGVNPTHPEINFATGTFLYYVLDGIVQTNLRIIEQREQETR